MRIRKIFIGVTAKGKTIKEKTDLTKKCFSMSEHFSKAIRTTYFYFYNIHGGKKNLIEINEIVKHLTRKLARGNE